MRIGRKTRLTEPQRAVLWSIFDRVRAGLSSRNMTTASGMFTRLAGAIAASKAPPFDFAVVDESQDMGVAHLRFFAALGEGRPDSLFFSGDLGQRLFQQPFSWLAPKRRGRPPKQPSQLLVIGPMSQGCRSEPPDAPVAA